MKTVDRPKTILWWGRFDPCYSRNRILRSLLHAAGYILEDFMPRISALAPFESIFASFKVPDAVWVPAFRQKDFRSARCYADRFQIPLIFDPFISAWDKSVFERKKFRETDKKARKILRWEQGMFSSADLVIADTEPHAKFFIEHLSAPPDKTFVVPVGAEESIFIKQPLHSPNTPPEVLFYGSFINLQGPEIIAEAALQVPEAHWTLLGQGDLRKVCEEKCTDREHIRFEDWQPYEHLPTRIGKADILLGIFGTSPKSGRVIPNKVYQALACGRPLITRESDAYPPQIANNMKSGITFIPAGNPTVLANMVKKMLATPDMLIESGRQARLTYESYFCEARIGEALNTALAKL